MNSARPSDQAKKVVKKGSSRNQNILVTHKLRNRVEESSKRKAEISPGKKATMKRSAFGDLTNALGGKTEEDAQSSLAKGSVSNNVYRSKSSTAISQTAKLQSMSKIRGTINNLPAPSKPKIQGKSKSSANAEKSVPKSVAKLIRVSKLGELTLLTEKPEAEEATVKWCGLHTEQTLKETSTSSTASSETSSDSSLYTTASEELSDSSLTKREVQSRPQETEDRSGISRVPNGVWDYDYENVKDAYHVSTYAMDIFQYLKTRESKFLVKDYMPSQISISHWMRALLVDWMVEVQESFELNHETLYLGVKLVDHFLSKVTIPKETLQLIGAAALLIASKFDERLPPLVSDFIYVGDGAYTKNELLQMECNLFKIVGYDLGIPLSYRFLRRYARVAKLDLPQLTLARYILETSLMEYTFVTVSDSKMAAAALYLTLKMKHISGWTPTLEYFSGYKLEDFKYLVYLLNSMLHKKPREALKTIRSKYSHKVFFEVALTPLVQDVDL